MTRMPFVVAALALVAGYQTRPVMQLARAADEPVTVIARVYASPGREAELESRLQKIADFVHKSEPAATYFFLRATNTPGLYMSYEIYPSKAAADEHLKVTFPAALKVLGPPAAGLLVRPTEIETLTRFTN